MKAGSLIGQDVLPRRVEPQSAIRLWGDCPLCSMLLAPKGVTGHVGYSEEQDADKGDKMPKSLILGIGNRNGESDDRFGLKDGTLPENCGI